MITRYNIKITEIGEDTQSVGGRWDRVSGNKEDVEYGYTPEHESIREYEREIYAQTVTDFSLSDVVIAVNKLNNK